MSFFDAKKVECVLEDVFFLSTVRLHRQVSEYWNYKIYSVSPTRVGSTFGGRTAVENLRGNVRCECPARFTAKMNKTERQTDLPQELFYGQGRPASPGVASSR